MSRPCAAVRQCPAPSSECGNGAASSVFSLFAESYSYRHELGRSSNGLLDRLAFLALYALIGVLDALALVRLRRIVRAQLSRNLSDHLLARPFHGDLRIFFDRHLYLVRNRVVNRVR